MTLNIEPGPRDRDLASNKVNYVFSTLDDWARADIFWKGKFDWVLKSGYLVHHAGTKERGSLSDKGYPWRTRATHLKTGEQVVLSKSRDPFEARISECLHSGELLADPRNHCVRPREILVHPSEPSIQILVLPHLRRFDEPPFETMGEVVDFIGQVFEGVAFMHEKGVAHMGLSVFQALIEFEADGMHCRGSASSNYSRTEHPPKYYFTDFWLSLRARNPMVPHLSSRRVTPDPTVPELGRYEAWSPFLMDVYCLGNMLKHIVTEGFPRTGQTGNPWSEFELEGKAAHKELLGYEGFNFLSPLLERMTRREPTERPAMSEILEEFQRLVGGLNDSTLRSRCRRKPEFTGERPTLRVTEQLTHWFKKASHIARGLPAIPKRH